MNKKLSANTNLSHYPIVKKIGAGGMGEVYLAEDTKLKGTDVKLLPVVFPESNGAAELRSMFLFLDCVD